MCQQVPNEFYLDRTAWRSAVFVGKRYGSKGHPRRNFHLFSPLKQHLSGQRFPDDDAVERAAWVWFRQQPQEFYAAGFQGLVKQWDKCLNFYGDYVEK